MIVPQSTVSQLPYVQDLIAKSEGRVTEEEPDRFVTIDEQKHALYQIRFRKHMAEICGNPVLLAITLEVFPWRLLNLVVDSSLHTKELDMDALKQALSPAIMSAYLQSIIRESADALDACLNWLYEESDTELSFGEFVCKTEAVEPLIRMYEATLHVNAARMIVPQSQESLLPYIQDQETAEYVEGVAAQVAAEANLTGFDHHIVFPRNPAESPEQWHKRIDQLNKVFRERREPGENHNGRLPIVPRKPVEAKPVEKQQARMIGPIEPETVIVYSSTASAQPRQVRVRA